LSVTIEIPGHLLQLVDSHKTVEVEGTTVRECLLNLAWNYPGLAPEVFDVNGELAVIVLHGETPIDGLTIDSPVRDGDVLRLFPIIIGG
jgi:molybdopterin converting factor small subunit